MARGDHIFVYSLGYSHHGIDCGDGRVVHFDYGPGRKLTSALRAETPRVSEVSLDQFARGRPVNVRQYRVCDSAHVVIARARLRIGEQCYNVFKNNCEHFAVWCKTGQHQSTQVEAIVEALRPLPREVGLAAVLVRSSRYLPRPARMWTYAVAAAVTAGAFAGRYLENRWRNYLRRES
jgi:hypothetical protein